MESCSVSTLLTSSARESDRKVLQCWARASGMCFRQRLKGMREPNCRHKSIWNSSPNSFFI